MGINERTRTGFLLSTQEYTAAMPIPKTAMGHTLLNCMRCSEIALWATGSSRKVNGSLPMCTPQLMGCRDASLPSCSSVKNWAGGVFSSYSNKCILVTLSTLRVRRKSGRALYCLIYKMRSIYETINAG
jgi:hypothetical protein